MAEKASSPMTPLRLRRNKQLECDDNDSIACVYDNIPLLRLRIPVVGAKRWPCPRLQRVDKDTIDRTVDPCRSPFRIRYNLDSKCFDILVDSASNFVRQFGHVWSESRIRPRHCRTGTYEHLDPIPDPEDSCPRRPTRRLDGPVRPGRRSDEEEAIHATPVLD